MISLGEERRMIPGATLTPVTSENDARSALEREIYWAEDASVRSRMRRKTKVLQFRLLRPMRRRNDRLLAEFGELAAALADRVVALETEVKELQAKLGDAE